ncbi:hypothetical protein Tco_1232181 [Tanacetum coccineum]
MEYLVKISKKARILELKRRHLKITVLTSNTPYPSRKIRRICACTSQKDPQETRTNTSYPREDTRRVSEAAAGLVLLLQHGAGDSGPDMSFDTSASPEYVFGLHRVSLAKVVSCMSHSVAPEETIPHHWSRIKNPRRANDVLSYFQLGYEGATSEGTTLNQTLI